MTWRMSVVHKTSYEYESEVLASFNELKMTPTSGAGQLLVQHQTSVQPFVSLFTYRDYWGTTVEAFDLHTPHSLLHVSSESVVETWTAKRTPIALTWNDLHSFHVTDKFGEYLRHTRLSPELSQDPEIHDRLQSAPSPFEAVQNCVALVWSQMTYTPGSTHVYTPGNEAWATRLGVCQDYSHIALSMLRSLGIPARYVSGYHYTGSGEIDEPVIAESHAWLEAWVGEWLPFDPTNGNDVDQRHVVVAYGRDYGDVSPMRGIFSGGQSKSTQVSVTLTRLQR